MKAVYMPALGMAQKTGTLLEWHKQAGESVVAGEPLMLVATDKTGVEKIEARSGVLPLSAHSREMKCRFAS